MRVLNLPPRALICDKVSKKVATLGKDQLAPSSPLILSPAAIIPIAIRIDLQPLSVSLMVNILTLIVGPITQQQPHLSRTHLELGGS